MNRNHLFSAALLLVLASNASATSIVATVDSLLGGMTATLEGSSDATSSLRDSKIVRNARDDLASFIASNGDIRSARLEAALSFARTQAPQLSTSSDLQLATALLAD